MILLSRFRLSQAIPLAAPSVGPRYAYSALLASGKTPQGTNGSRSPLGVIALQHFSGSSGSSSTPTLDAPDDLSSFKSTPRQDASADIPRRQAVCELEGASLCRSW